MARRRIHGLSFAAMAAAFLLVACNSTPIEQSYPESAPGDKNKVRKSDDPAPNTLLGSGGGLDVMGIGGNRNREGGGGAGIGVNSYLWRASLDTVSFMPLASADPFGGVIITEWFTPPETPDERFKMNIYILGRELRADGLRVSVFRQNRCGDDCWNAAAVASDTAINLENQILTRARQLRIATANR